MAASSLGACPDARTGAAAIAQDSALWVKEMLWNAFFCFPSEAACSPRKGCESSVWGMGMGASHRRNHSGSGHPLGAALLGCQWRVTGSAVRYHYHSTYAKERLGRGRQKSLSSFSNKSGLSHSQLSLWWWHDHKVWDFRTLTHLCTVQRVDLGSQQAQCSWSTRIACCPQVNPVCYYSKLSKLRRGTSEGVYFSLPTPSLYASEVPVRQQHFFCITY